MNVTKSFTRFIVMLAVFVLLVAAGATLAQDAVTLGTPIDGTYSGDVVYYTVDLTAGQLLILDLQSEEFDTQVSVEQGGNELASDDDGGEGSNSLLAFVAQADGTYDIGVDAWFFDADSGAYTLLANVIDPTVVDIDGSVTLEPAAEGSAQLYAVFQSTTGSVVNVLGSTSGEDEDVEVELFGPDGSSIERDDDDGAGDNALIRRVVLPGDGYYLIVATAAYSDDLLIAPVEIAVEGTEQLFLSSDPQPLVLGDGEGHIGTEVYTIDVTAGSVYRIIMTIESIPDEDAGVSMELLDTNFFFEPTMETRHSTGLVWEYTALESGQIRLDVHPNFFGQDIFEINYTIALEIAE